MRCAGSVAASEGVPDRSSAFADEGTAAHTVAAWCLERGHDPMQYYREQVRVPSRDGSSFTQWECDDEMVDALTEYIGKVFIIFDDQQRLLPTGAGRCLGQRRKG